MGVGIRKPRAGIKFFLRSLRNDARVSAAVHLWIPLLCFLVLSYALTVRTVHSVRQADAWADTPTYSRVEMWIKSSECTVETGALLAVCGPQGRAGIEDHSLADDRGHTLLANLYSLITGRVIDRKDLTIGNVLLNAFTFLGLALAFYVYGWKITSLLLLLVGSRMAIPGPHPGPDSPATYIAAFNLAMIAILWAVHAPLGRERKSRRRFVLGLCLAAFCLTWSTLIRQPYGVGGYLVVIFVVAMRALLQSKASEPHSVARVSSWRAGVAVICLGLSTSYSTSALITARDAIYGIPRGAALLQHGIGHNLYIGLGVEGNPWGIVWSDDFAYKAANAVGTARYGSEEHYRNLWKLYFHTVLNSPVQVAQIYTEKLRDSLRIVAGQRAAWAMLAILLLLTVLRRDIERHWIVAALAVWAGFAIVILQGVLAMPSSFFISPGKVAIVAGIALLADIITKAVGRRCSRPAALR